MVNLTANSTVFNVPTNMTSFVDLFRYDQSVSPMFALSIVVMTIILGYITLRRWGVEQAGTAAMFAGTIVSILLWLLAILPGEWMAIVIVGFGITFVARWFE